MPTFINTNLMALNTANNLSGHYSKLSTSVERLSSGLRINSSADDAAGLAIRELMRADVAALNQGVRNANDAISMLQVADGALGIIDEKLIRMKELAEQAATGTYNSTQRLMIHSEFQAMGEEIDRIARATDFNGIKLLDGSLSGKHNGSGLTATGAMKIHFGTANDSAEDYYYIEIGDCTLAGLGLRDKPSATTHDNAIHAISKISGNIKNDQYGGVPILSDNLSKDVEKIFISGVIPVGIIPAGSTNINIFLDDAGLEDSIQIFTRDGKHIAGTTLTTWNVYPPITENTLLIESNGFLSNAQYDGTVINGIGSNINFIDENTLTNISYKGMDIGYTGDGSNNFFHPNRYEKLTINNVTEDLIFIVAGQGGFSITASWDQLPSATNPPVNPNPPGPGIDPSPPPAHPQGDIISIRTQDEAQQALERIDNAIVQKDKVRAHLGAMQNRLENTVTNLTIQGENLQTAESRISDVDVATEMTQFVRNQVITQSAVAMLGQANSYPHMLMNLLTR